ncbi:MAG: class A beta-lactamase [Steroidobacteraceae bacterium]
MRTARNIVAGNAVTGHPVSHRAPRNTLSRRQLIRGVRDGLALALMPGGSVLRAAEAPDPFAALEAASGGRLGVAALDTGTGRTHAHRGDERFGMCSTFKLPLAGVILQAADRGELSLDQRVHYTERDLVPHAPVTSQFLARGWMTVAELAEATQTTSDNVAANLLLGLLGGPAGFTERLRRTGDDVTRLDRLEPSMNHVLPGQLEDTTTPLAMARTTARFAVADALDAPSRERLVGWMVATNTGLRRLRAGLPDGWRAGDKTGTGMAEGMPDRYNDVAVAFPPGRAPLVIAAYYESGVRSESIRPEDEAVLAAAARIAVAWFDAGA